MQRRHANRTTQHRRVFRIALCLAAVAGAHLPGCGGDSGSDTQPREPLRLHPDNPRYFEFRGEPTVLITSGEHYGAVINADFDYVRYLDELERHRFNQTRLFSGAYIEAETSIEGVQGNNTLAPEPGRFVSPWPRAAERGLPAETGLERQRKFDLTRWNSAYFERLKDFVREAGRRGIVVEMVFFSALYDADRWTASPFNPDNNTSAAGPGGPADLYKLDNGGALEFQDALVRKIVTELRSFDNVYYEVFNEPWEWPRPSDEWQDHIVETIADTESGFDKRHLIARNYWHEDARIRDPNPSVSVFNLHKFRDPADFDNVEGVIGFDETGFEGTDDAPYRTDGWLFMLSGGAVYSNLDWSFATGREDGSYEFPAATPGGGGPSLRRSLAVLKTFMERFDLPRMRPAPQIVTAAPRGATTRALEDIANSYAVHVKGAERGRLSVDIAAGRYRAEWIDTKDGSVKGSQVLDHDGGDATLTIPPHDEDIALAIEAE